MASRGAQVGRRRSPQTPIESPRSKQMVILLPSLPLDFSGVGRTPP